MHIPDGFLDTKTAIASASISIIGISAAYRNLKRNLDSKDVPMIALMAAFVFVAQMLNFPIAAGTSGHLIGATLAAVILGPSAAIIVLTLVLIVQCFLFADGGLLALGANVLNMAISGSLIGYASYRVIKLIIPNDMGKFIAIAFASWLSTVTASVLCAGELAWSGTVNWSLGFPAMANVHMFIGIGEAVITTLVIAGIWKTRPELLERENLITTNTQKRTSLIYIGIMAIAIGLFISPFVSNLPDGLEKVASTFGFEQKADVKPIIPQLIDYQFKGINQIELATIVAGLIGVVVILGISYFLARLITNKSK